MPHGSRESHLSLLWRRCARLCLHSHDLANVAARGHHIFQMTDLESSVGLSHVHSISPATNLVHGSKYLVDLYYQDAVCNPIQSSGSIEVSFASNFTLQPLLYFPTSSSVIGQIFKVRFVFIEAGLQNTTKVTFYALTPDSSPPPAVCGYGTVDAYNHSLVLSDYSEGPQEFFTADYPLPLVPRWSSDIDYVVPADKALVDGACYRVTLSYQDGAGNPEASVSRDLVRYAGNETMPLPTFEPVSNIGSKKRLYLSTHCLNPRKKGL